MDIKILYLIIVMMFVCLRHYGQTNSCDCSSEEDYENRFITGLIGIEYTNPVETYKGQQYFDDWRYGEITFENGTHFRNLMLRYDKYSDLLLWMRKSDYKKGILNKENIRNFTLVEEGNRLPAYFIKKRVLFTRSDSTEVFLQVLVSGNINLYAYRNVNVVTVEYILSDNTKYLVEVKGKVYAISLQRRNLLNIPEINKVEMKQVIKDNHISLKDNEQGMVHALLWYNQRITGK